MTWEIFKQKGDYTRVFIFGTHIQTSSHCFDKQTIRTRVNYINQKPREYGSVSFIWRKASEANNKCLSDTVESNTNDAEKCESKGHLHTQSRHMEVEV